MKRWNY